MLLDITKRPFEIQTSMASYCNQGWLFLSEMLDSRGRYVYSYDMIRNIIYYVYIQLSLHMRFNQSTDLIRYDDDEGVQVQVFCLPSNWAFPHTISTFFCFFKITSFTGSLISVLSYYTFDLLSACPSLFLNHPHQYHQALLPHTPYIACFLKLF